MQISVGLFLCFVATGAQWDLLQTFAWGRMMTHYSRTMPLSQAVAKTFDGEMCGICRAVANARKEEQSRSNAPEARIDSKILVFFQEVPQMSVGEPDAVAWFPGDLPAMTELSWAPPVPPPRSALG